MRPAIIVLLNAVLTIAQDVPAFRSDVSLVHVDVEVTDGSRLLTGFHKEDFLVKDNGTSQTILYFSQDEEPLDVILLFDISGSMRPKVAKVAASAHAAFAELRHGDRIAVMTFHNRSRLVAPFTEDLEQVERTIQEDVVQGRFRGGTRILAAVENAAKHLSQEPRTQRRRAVLILTDDYGQRSRRASTVVHALWEADASLSGLIIRRPGETAVTTVARISNPALLMLQEGMDGVAEKTGGETMKADDAGDAFREIMHRLRLRYSIYYAMPPGKAGEQRQVKVELTGDALRSHSSARVRARKGYVIPTGG